MDLQGQRHHNCEASASVDAGLGTIEVGVLVARLMATFSLNRPHVVLPKDAFSQAMTTTFLNSNPLNFGMLSIAPPKDACCRYSSTKLIVSGTEVPLSDSDVRNSRSMTLVTAL